MRVLVIGGTGVLSRAIAIECVAAGHEVTILTDGAGHLSEPAGVERHLKVDRRNGAALAAALSETGVTHWDLVVDAVCYDEQQASSLINSVNGKSGHTLVISSAVVYDRKNPLPLRVDAPPAPPSELGDYGVGKIRMERAWLEAAWALKHPVTILRLPHILGVGCELGVVPLHNRDPLLLQRLRNCRPLLLADGGRQLLQVVFNEDVARVILAACGKSQAFGKIYNCANPEIITGGLYFEEVARLLGTPFEVKNVPSEAIWHSDWGWAPTTISRILDLDTLQRDVGLVPSTPLAEALRVSLSYLESYPRERDDSFSRYLDDIEKDLDRSDDDLRRLLSACAARRIKTAVDVRMNSVPPEFR